MVRVEESDKYERMLIEGEEKWRCKKKREGQKSNKQCPSAHSWVTNLLFSSAKLALARRGMLEGEMWQCSHSECPAMCICNMLLSSLCHAELLKSDWLEGWTGGFSGRQARMFTLHSDDQTLNMLWFTFPVDFGFLHSAHVLSER